MWNDGQLSSVRACDACVSVWGTEWISSYIHVDVKHDIINRFNDITICIEDDIKEIIRCTIYI